ncbi:MAG: hypothetical protein DDT41_01781 [candidate division WS2 bacterium]|nr:hypothetical protein [Candidatus Psychracetigena formicireducens]
MGWLGDLTPDGKINVLAMSEVGWNECDIPSKAVPVLPVSESLWGKFLINNDPSDDPRRGGLPPGHLPLNSFIGYPLRLEGKNIWNACPG